MVYIIIGVVVAVIVIGIGVFFFIKFKKKPNRPIQKNELATLEQESKQLIPVETLPLDAIKDESQLVEIKDSKVLAQINNLVPGLAKGATSIAQAKAGPLYRVILPAGEKLADSKAIKGAKRAIYHGKDGIKGQADLMEVKGLTAANTISSAMNVASLVVGQYYMSQVNSKLDGINDGISQIQDFQDNEYKSKVLSLLAHVKKIAEFKTEILSNDELRKSKINQLDNLEVKCSELLGQATITLESYSKMNNLDYKQYEKETANAQKWFMYQKWLLDLSYKISDLQYALHLGIESKEQCENITATYANQVNQSLDRLASWHKETTKRLNIHENEARRERNFKDKIIHFVPSLIKKDKNYMNFDSIKKETVMMIKEQSIGHHELHEMDNSELYNKDVELISKNGKIYYLPKSEN